MSSSRYPDLPGYRVAGTTQEAAETLAPVAANLRAQVLETIANSDGMTADAVAKHLNRSVLAVRPRLSELRRLGAIRPSGGRGRNRSGLSAAIWVASSNLGDRQ